MRAVSVSEMKFSDAPDESDVPNDSHAAAAASQDSTENSDAANSVNYGHYFVRQGSDPDNTSNDHLANPSYATHPDLPNTMAVERKVSAGSWGACKTHCNGGVPLFLIPHSD